MICSEKALGPFAATCIAGRHPSPAEGLQLFVTDLIKVEGLNNLAIEKIRSGPCHATFGRIACYAMAATNLSRIHR
jgi:hypothetical protein